MQVRISYRQMTPQARETTTIKVQLLRKNTHKRRIGDRRAHIADKILQIIIQGGAITNFSQILRLVRMQPRPVLLSLANSEK